MTTLRSLLSNGATAVLVVCALAMTTVTLRREFAPAPANPRAIQKEATWRDYLNVGQRIGSPNAKVVLVQFAAYQCPACRQLEARLRETQKKFGDSFAVEFRHFPLTKIHPYATEAAIASECASKQGQFDVMHATLFDKQDSIGKLSWKAMAKRADVRDLVAFDTCMRDSSITNVIERDKAAGEKLNVRGTPTALINGVRFTGSLRQETLDSLVSDALETSRKTSR